MTMDFKPAASLTEQIANHLSDEIIAGRLAPCERIAELKVAGDLGVSRGSVREALLIVERRHLITIVARRGAIVSRLDPGAIRDLTEFYAELMLMLLCRTAADVAGEPNAAQLAGFRRALADMTEQQDANAIDALVAAKLAFCRAAIELPGNSYLRSVVGNLTSAMHRVSRRAAEHPHFDPRDVTRFARALLDAVICNDRTRLAELLRAHFRREASLAIDANLG
jgi:DNA-binding GntR family transcriptional regulator